MSVLCPGISKNADPEKVIGTIINIFQQIPAAGSRFIELLCQLILHNEKAMLIGASSPFREPLMGFLLRYPDETMQLFLKDNNIKVDKDTLEYHFYKWFKLKSFTAFHMKKRYFLIFHSET